MLVILIDDALFTTLFYLYILTFIDYSGVDVVQEYGAQVITTTPTVPYIFEYSDGR